MEIYHTDALFKSIPDYDYHFLRSDALYVCRYLPNCKDLLSAFQVQALNKLDSDKFLLAGNNITKGNSRSV